MKEVKGTFTELDGEEFYKISNYDCMEDFFMTITSSCDVWNFCWSHGGITAGRINSAYSVFPYMNGDKLQDSKNVTGSMTVVAKKTPEGTKFWEPFKDLRTATNYSPETEENLERNIYKNENGTKVWFEEINKELGLTFRYGWTSSAKYGLVKTSYIENNGADCQVMVLDGCRNIVPACVDASTNEANSELLNAYKKTDLADTNIALFTLSSVLTDKAEPSEGLLANISWFTTNDRIILNNNAVKEFYKAQDVKKIDAPEVLKGERGCAYIAKEISLKSKESSQWKQVFDTAMDSSRIVALGNTIADRAKADQLVSEDIKATEELMTAYIKESDGKQNTASKMNCVHHSENVMFNIMRGGFFADGGKINGPDFIKFIESREKALAPKAAEALGELAKTNSVAKTAIEQKILESNNDQLKRLFLEYTPLIFSRRHGDPSRPWNKFNIMLNDKDGNPILNYEGNWRDIFQNWEALAWSYPAYIKNMCAKFLNAMTAEGFNPYRISRAGIDWETPEPDNPWAQYGYWGDHQVIYFEKLLELWNMTDSDSLKSSLNEMIYSSANVPYRLKSYAEILEAPRNSIAFDQELSDKLIKEAKEFGSDRKLIQKDGKTAHVSLTAKILQIVIAKAANLVPAGGIWMNTQRPEWNDANNALAGYGLSVVTLNYLYRMISFLTKLYADAKDDTFTLPEAEAKCFKSLADLFKSTDMEKACSDDCERRTFVDKAGALFEAERNEFYAKGYDGKNVDLSKAEIIEDLNAILSSLKINLDKNKRDDNLYHTYNTLVIEEGKMKVLPLQIMLEGQVAALSSGCLSFEECAKLLDAMKSSALYESRQKSYTLYPNKELPHFMKKNCVCADDAKSVSVLLERTGNGIMSKDANGTYHFNPSFKNARFMQDYCESLDVKPTADEMNALLSIYEKTFNHQEFTGRSGTFYAYEGLGSIYWHMVSKLLLAVQENALEAIKKGDKLADKLVAEYFEVQNGLSYRKTPDLYGAFPADPYSHTPYLKGARQPGMTGQVKEEVLTRWGELGLLVENGKAAFRPVLLQKEEYLADGTLSFTWCGVDVTYCQSSAKCIEVALCDNTTQKIEGDTLTAELSKELFNRSGKIKGIKVSL